MMKRSLCLLAITAPLLLSAALPPLRPIPHERPSDIVQVNFLTRLLEGNTGNRRSSSHRRANRSSQERAATPQPPAPANVPVPLPKPTEQAQANTDAPKDNAIQPDDKTKDLTVEKAQEEKKSPPAPIAPVEPQRQAKAPKDEQPRKEEAQAPAPDNAEPQANPPAIAEVPVPQSKPATPEQPVTAATDIGPKPDGKEIEEQKAEAPPPPPPLVKENPEELKACLAELTTLGAKFEPTDPIDDGNGCGIEHPIDVDEVLPGVNLGGATMRCKTAVTMAHWLKDTVQPAMNIAMPGRKIVGLVPGSTYACRLRNSAATGKISEHARGNAYDVAAFKLDNGERMEMKPRVEDSTIEGAFQRTATAGACLHFTTVLSPGSDAAHETHLHLDVLERKGGYRYCR
ncbi:extensin family protein [Rhizobium populisoli]|uniref:extensin family protein n=1 Tax=Rhizobium populisoli TaxID=2859785 RepID=UPI001FE3B7D2|nr:extensin family protein [Rhizobium populisoli]